jgi:hypothetical protein
MAWPESLPTIQLIVFPLLLIAAAAMSFRGLRVPRSLLLIALSGATLSAFSTYYFLADSSRSIMVTTLDGDLHSAETRIFRERINHYSKGRGGVHAVGFRATPRNYSQAHDLLVKDNLRALVWGNSYWMNLSFPEEMSRIAAEFGGAEHLGPLGKLRIVTSVPSVGMSYEPKNETADFISGISAALLPPVDPLQKVALEDFGRRELALLDTANIAGTWTTPAHRALPWWMLGNLYLFDILRSSTMEPGELRCAQAAYDRARSYLKIKDNYNLELTAAVLNNLAIVTVLEGIRDGEPKLLKRARSFLHPVSKTVKKTPNVFGVKERANVVARKNLRLLKDYIHKQGHDKKKPKKHRKKQQP